ncbi:MAG: right-handed parallel beta-helix repeat-containing protein [Candidatus Hydrogenedentota bacterium]
MKLKLWCIAAMALCAVGSVGAQEAEAIVYVAPDGDDANPGTAEEPLASLEAAQETVREMLADDKAQSVEVRLSGGVYRIEEPLQFGPADSPAEGYTVTWTAAPDAEPRISGGRVITGWEETEDGAFSTTLEAVQEGEWYFHELFVNGERRQRARYPSEGFAHVDEVGADRRTNFTFHPEDIPEALEGDLSATDLELVFFHDWSTSRTPVESINREENRLRTSRQVGPSLDFFHMDNWESNPRYYLENHPALLDSPGEWYLDRDSGELTYIPMEGEAPGDIEAVAPIAEGLVTARGTEEAPLRGLIFRGLHFEHAAWHSPEAYRGVQATGHEPEWGAGWDFVPAALSFELADECAIEDGSIRRVGRGGVWFGERASNNRVTGNVIDDVAGNGILIGEDRGRQVDGQPWIDVAPEQAASNNVVEDNVIQRCGVRFFGAVGVWVGMAADTEIRHNTIRQLPYTGVSVGWLWNPEPTPCQGTIVEANHIHDVMQVLSDGGGIYTLGLQPGAVLRDNLIHSVPLNLGRAESNGMFIDEGSKELLIEGNAIFDIDRSPLRFHQAEENTVRDNILVIPDEDTPMVRYNATPEENIELIDNTIMTMAEFSEEAVADFRENTGPRAMPADVPDPTDAFAPWAPESR